MGAAVRGAFASANMSLADAAAALPMAINTLSRRINGHSSFTWSEIVRAAEVSGSSAGEIVSVAERVAAQSLDRGQVAEAVGA